MPGVPLLTVWSNSHIYAAEECCTLMPGRISSVLPALAETVCFYTLEHLVLEHCDYLWVWGFFVQFKVTEITWCLCHRERCFNIRRLTMCSVLCKVIRGCDIYPTGLGSWVHCNRIWPIWNCLQGLPSPDWPWVSPWKTTSSGERTFAGSKEESWVISSCRWYRDTKHNLLLLKVCYRFGY